MRTKVLGIPERTVDCLRLPGSHPALSDCANQWEQTSRSRRSALGGFIQNISSCQHPNFVFRRTPKTEPRLRKLLFIIKGLLQSLALRGAAVFSDGRVLGGAFFPVNDPSAKHQKKLKALASLRWKTLLNHQSLRATPLAVLIWELTPPSSRAVAMVAAFSQFRRICWPKTRNRLYTQNPPLLPVCRSQR